MDRQYTFGFVVLHYGGIETTKECIAEFNIFVEKIQRLLSWTTVLRMARAENCELLYRSEGSICIAEFVESGVCPRKQCGIPVFARAKTL